MYKSVDEEKLYTEYLIKYNSIHILKTNYMP